MAASPSSSTIGLNQLKQSDSSTTAPSTEQGGLTILKQDSGTNLSVMNISIEVSPTYGTSQVVKFTAPKSDWKLENVLVMATDGWNKSSQQYPDYLPFAIEVRDADLRLLHHFSDTQVPYFTAMEGIRMANIELPSIPVNGDFYVCFYGYLSLALVTELQNATNNSYYFDKQTGLLYPGLLQLNDNQTLPVNWLIRAAGR